jgi:hypothetical protein
MNLEGDTTCPHCKKDHTASFNLDKLDIKTPASELTNVTATETSQVLEKKPEPEPTPEPIIVSPSDVPFFPCKDGNCGEIHENPNYSKAPNKKCKNCDTLNGIKKCKNCKNSDPEEFDELDNEELIEMGIPIPNEHEGHNHG